MKEVSFAFEPGDIVSTVMSFGSPAPVEVLVIGPERDDVRKHALSVLAQMQKIHQLRDVQLYQQLDYPTMAVDIDRQKAGLSGVNVKDVTDALLVGTSSSRYVVRNYWRDPRSGVDYQVQVQVPTQRMNRAQQVGTLPIRKVSDDSNLLIRDVATVQPGVTPGEIDRSAMQRYLSITANVEGEDLGRATAQIDRAIHAVELRKTPRGVRVEVRGQVAPMNENVPLPGRRPGPLGGGDPGAADRLFPVVPAGADLHRRRAGRDPRRGHDPAADRHHVEHRIVHGLDHVHRRLGVQLGAACPPSWTTTGRPGHRSARPPSRAPATASAPSS